MIPAGLLKLHLGFIVAYLLGRMDLLLTQDLCYLLCNLIFDLLVDTFEDSRSRIA